jgi:hypothetical protein
MIKSIALAILLIPSLLFGGQGMGPGPGTGITYLGGSPPLSLTLSTTDKYADIVLSNGNLTAELAPAVWASVRATEALPAGKWYWECNQYYLLSFCGMATSSQALNNYIGSSAEGLGNLSTSGTTYYNGASITGFPSVSGTDITMVAYDSAAGKVWFGKNGTWFTYGGGTGNPATGAYPVYSSIPASSWYPAMSLQAGAASVNFGTSAFSYTVPSGFTGVNQ